MKKLSALLFTFVFLGAIAAFAACPCQQPACDEPCGAAATPAPLCESCPAVPCEEECKPACPCHPCPCLCKKMTQEELYKKLCLSECQLEKAEALYDKLKCDTQDLREKLQCEKDKLCTLKEKCASKCEIKAQKNKIKALKKDLKCFCDNYEAQFECILTKEQKTCYKKIKKAETSIYKKCLKNKKKSCH